jgi:aarF domain-containing kinase
MLLLRARPPTIATAIRSTRRGVSSGGKPSGSSLFPPSRRSVHGKPFFSRSWQAPAIASVVGCSWRLSSTSCDALSTLPPNNRIVPTTPSILSTEGEAGLTWKALRRKARRALRMLVRLVKLAVTLAPVVAFYPLLMLTHQRDTSRDAQNIILAQDSNVGGALGWYLRLCLHCVELSGAAVIKFMQWAGSRPDLFGHDFCSVFSQLQDDTTPHSWKHSVEVLEQAFGPDWKTKIQLFEVLGSGCIGQVYRGQVVQEDNNNPREVAVKVLHPNVEEDIDADLDLMRVSVRALDWVPFGIFRNLKWLNLEGIVEEFASLLKEQLDLRGEAANLERFNKNFAGDPCIVFPELIPGYTASKHVLVETFCPGVPVLQFAREHQDDRALLHNLCKTAVRAVCKMIFLDNFMHGDCHPGNVRISPDGKKFILLDVGIVVEYTNSDHEMLVDVLAAFIRKEGRRAGRLMIDDSNNRLKVANTGEVALEEEHYIDKIEALTIKASGKDYLMENLGQYISYICDAASTHHVMLNQSFVTASLAVKVEEGIALALDPSMEIWKIATPIIVESESRRTLQRVGAPWTAWQGWDEMYEGIFGSSNKDAK